MTRDQLHINFKIAMDKNSQSVAFGGCPAFLPEEIDYWLNLGLQQEISNKFTGQNNLQQAFEKSVKRIHDLEKLVQTDVNVSAIKESGINRCYIANLFNEQRMFFVDALFNFGSNKTPVNLVDHISAKRFKKSYNNNPWIDTPIATIEDNTLYVYYDDISMAADNYSVDLTYVKVPTKIEDLPSSGVNELPEYMWNEVVNRSVELALEDIESRRVQTKSQLNTIDE